MPAKAPPPKKPRTTIRFEDKGELHSVLWINGRPFKRHDLVVLDQALRSGESKGMVTCVHRDHVCVYVCTGPVVVEANRVGKGCRGNLRVPYGSALDGHDRDYHTCLARGLDDYDIRHPGDPSWLEIAEAEATPIAREP